MDSARFSSTYTKIGMIQRRLAWPLCKDDMQIHEVFHILKIPDYLEKGISLIEWPERLEGNDAGITHVIQIKILSETEREITVEKLR